MSTLRAILAPLGQAAPVSLYGRGAYRSPFAYDR